MLLEKKVQITVFQLDNNTFEPIGDISQYTSLIWPDAFNGYANFELWAPSSEDNMLLLRNGNVLWAGGDNACVIEIVKSDFDEDGEKTFDVKGRTLEKLIEDRINWGTYNFTNAYTSSIIYSLVNSACINPVNKNRKIPWLENATDLQLGNKIDTFQETGQPVYDTIYKLATDADLGFSVKFDPYNKKLIFEVQKGRDLTENNKEGNDPVVFSSQLEDILSSSYYMNVQDERTVAFIQGEGDGAARKSTQTGITSGVGFDRRELYVDARDLQSESTDENGNTQSLTPAQYLEALVQRGQEKLAEYAKVETFEASIRQFGDVQYEFGTDYKKGDMVTVIDEQLGVSVSARITSVEEDFGDEYSLVLTFGYAYPTILQKVKRQTT